MVTLMSTSKFDYIRHEFWLLPRNASTEICGYVIASIQMNAHCMNYCHDTGNFRVSDKTVPTSTLFFMMIIELRIPMLKDLRFFQLSWFLAFLKTEIIITNHLSISINSKKLHEFVIKDLSITHPVLVPFLFSIFYKFLRFKWETKSFLIWFPGIFVY